jgi:hypothetical protein
MNKTFKQFYTENSLVPVKAVVAKKQQTGIDEKFMKLFDNLINLYKGLKVLKKSDETADYILFTLKPVFKLLNNGVRNNNFSNIDFSQFNDQQLRLKIKGLTASINLGLNSMAEFYSLTDNDRMSDIMEKAINKFSTTVSLVDNL